MNPLPPFVHTMFNLIEPCITNEANAMESQKRKKKYERIQGE